MTMQAIETPAVINTSGTTPAQRAKAREAQKKAQAKRAKRLATAPTPTEGTAGSQSPLHILRVDYVSGELKSYGRLAAYADQLAKTFGADWIKIPRAGPVSDNMLAVRKQINAERKALIELGKSRNHSNPQMLWARVKAHARGDVKRGKPEKRDLGTRIKEDLTVIYKALYNAYDAATPNQIAAFELITQALVKLGVNPANIATRD